MTNFTIIAFLFGIGVSFLFRKSKPTAKKKKPSLFARLRTSPKNLDELERELGITKEGKPDIELEAFRIERINRWQTELLEK